MRGVRGKAAKMKTTTRKAAPAVNTAQLAAELKTSTRQVRAWVARGLPCVRRKKPGAYGKPACWFKLTEVKAWVNENSPRFKEKATAEAEDALGDELPGMTSEKKPGRLTKVVAQVLGEAAGKIAGEGTDERNRAALSPDDFGDMVDRLRVQEQALYHLMNDAQKPALKAKYRRQWMPTVELRRKAEKDRAAIQTDSTKFVPIETVAKSLKTMATEIKMVFLALPRAMAPRLHGQQVAVIESMLTKEVDNCLTRLSKNQN